MPFPLFWELMGVLLAGSAAELESLFHHLFAATALEGGLHFFLDLTSLDLDTETLFRFRYPDIATFLFHLSHLLFVYDYSKTIEQDGQKNYSRNAVANAVSFLCGAQSVGKHLQERF